MSRAKLVLISILALLSIGATMSASASAADKCPETPGKQTLCVKGAPKEGTTAFTSKLVGVTLLEVPSLELHIECSEATNTGNFVQGKVLEVALVISNLVIDFHGCIILGTLGEKCEVKEGLIVTNAIKGAFPDVTPVTTVTLSPETGTTFAVVKIVNKGAATCPATIKGEKSVKGTQESKLITPETEAKEHEIQNLEPAGLTFAEAEAKLKLSETIKLTSGEEFSIKLA
jgi:hypothetical protein